MSRKYKFKDNDKLYFVTLTTVYWIDVFIRNEYKDTVLESIRFCQRNKGLEVYAWCIMPSHIHMIIGTKQNPLDGIIRDLKAFTSRHLRKIISENDTESRKKWMIWMMEVAGKRNSNNTDWQFWQQDNHPIELRDWEMTQQKLDYIHYNPIEAGFIDEAEAWVYSSAKDYSGSKGLLEIIPLF